MTPHHPRTDGRIDTSPDCGHTYPQRGNYTATLTTTYTAHWKINNTTGTLPITTTDTINIPIGELHTVITR